MTKKVKTQQPSSVQIKKMRATPQYMARFICDVIETPGVHGDALALEMLEEIWHAHCDLKDTHRNKCWELEVKRLRSDQWIDKTNARSNITHVCIEVADNQGGYF